MDNIRYDAYETIVVLTLSTFSWQGLVQQERT